MLDDHCEYKQASRILVWQDIVTVLEQAADDSLSVEELAGEGQNEGAHKATNEESVLVIEGNHQFVPQVGDSDESDGSLRWFRNTNRLEWHLLSVSPISCK